MILPAHNEKLGRWLTDKVIGPCNTSAENRMKTARVIKQWLQTGSDNDTPAIFNKIVEHCDKLASNLYSPADVRLLIEYENDYPKDILDQGRVAGRYLTREFARRNLDIEFGLANEVAVPYGAAILKSIWTHDGPGVELLMPWQIGVYREDVTSLDQQEAIVETTYITEEQFWRRIMHRRDAKELFKRAKSHAKRDHDNEYALPGGLAQILLSGSAPYVQQQGDPLQTGGAITSGIGQAARADPYSAGSLLKAHEGYIVNDETGDYTTFQLVEPDIVIHPRSLRTNLFMPMSHPYEIVQPNPEPNYIWGRSEIFDLVLLQAFIRDRLYDIKEIMNLQYTRLMEFVGYSGMNDERYDAFRESGWISNDMPTAKINDLTPPLPDHAFEELDHVIRFFDIVAGYDNVLSGRGGARYSKRRSFPGRSPCCFSPSPRSCDPRRASGGCLRGKDNVDDGRQRRSGALDKGERSRT